MRDLMKLKETEKSELERMTLNKSDVGGGVLEDKINRTNMKSKMNWSSQKDKA
jgi:hypothetical protein